MDAETANGFAGIASLVTSLLLVPTILSLRKIGEKHEERLDGHDRDLAELKAPKKSTRKRGRRGQL